jgi:predicted DNA-binding protein (MmcQ/YjbR family)
LLRSARQERSEQGSTCLISRDESKIEAVHSHQGQAEPDAIEDHIRSICLSLPGSEERASHGSPGFFAGRQFVMLWPDGHHDHGFPHMWCAAPPGAQEELTTAEPERFFRPPYVGHRGWIGVRLDGDVDWDEVASICAEAHRLIAPARFRRGEPAGPCQ